MSSQVDRARNEPGALPDDVEWALEGRLVEASNVVLRLATSGDGQTTSENLAADAPRAVYKPVVGERPLADFPRGTLAHREVATWIVANAMGWCCVPETRWFDGEFGEGSLQRWVGPLDAPEQEVVALLDENEFADAHDVHAIAAFEGEDGALILTHADTPTLRRIAVVDIVTNNADRKGSHLIEADGSLFAIDNGLTFHTDDKLRTVLWGFAGDELDDDATAALRRLIAERSAVTSLLAAHLSGVEIEALYARTEALLAAGTFPEPPEERYALPWPPL